MPKKITAWACEYCGEERPSYQQCCLHQCVCGLNPQVEACPTCNNHKDQRTIDTLFGFCIAYGKTILKNYIPDCEKWEAK